MLGPERMPVVDWWFENRDDDFVYGFPAVDTNRSTMKLATEKFLEAESPDADNSPSLESDAFFERCVRGRIRGVNSRLVRSSTCFYTCTPDRGFIIDWLPATNKQILLLSACSGHGFKHSAAVGEFVAAKLNEQRTIVDSAAFSLDRFQSDR